MDRKAPAIILIVIGTLAVIHSYAISEFTNVGSIIAGSVVLAVGIFYILPDVTLDNRRSNKRAYKVLAVVLIVAGLMVIIFNYILVTIPVNTLAMIAGAMIIGIGIVYIILAKKLRGLYPLAGASSDSNVQKATHTQSADSVESIPIEIKNLVQLCWGTTLNLSHESTQSNLGGKILDTVLPELKIDSKLKEKSLGVYMILSRTMRNIAFSRDAHVRRLDDHARRYNETRDLLESIGEISFSKESIPYKVISFLFFGSGLQYIFRSSPDKGQELLANDNVPVISGVLNTTIPEASKTSLIEDIVSFQQQQANISDILLFVFFGIVGILTVTVGFRIFTYLYLKRKEDEIRRDQNKYWNDNYIEDMTNILLRLYKDLNKLLYPGGSVAVEEQLIKWIKKDILPTAKIDWTIWIGHKKKDSSEEK
jgi:hypothetical protein